MNGLYRNNGDELDRRGDWVWKANMCRFHWFVAIRPRLGKGAWVKPTFK